MKKATEPDLSRVVNYLIEQTARQIKGYGQRQFDDAGAGITVDQWVVLKIIHEQRAITQVELAQIAQKDNASITRMLDLLQKKALIQRLDDDYDRRKYMISLTTSGIDFVKRMMPLVSRIRTSIVAGIPEKDLRSLKTILEKIRHNVSPSE